MKITKNWRYYVIFILFATGLLSLALVFGEDDRPIYEWLELRFWLAVISGMCFYILHKLTSYWESNGKIPEFTNQ